jgi:hypothetical protein
MTVNLSWMRRDAPYMPITTIGLLSVESQARALWRDGSLTIETQLDAAEMAELLLQAELPDLDAIGWPAGAGQSLATALSGYDDPLVGFAGLCSSVQGSVEERLLRTLATDQTRRSDGGPPARSRLLVGAKADLSPFRWRTRGDPKALADELALGPAFAGGDSGPSMGLVPEVHTFGGSVGREASTIGAASQLLSLLIRHGLLALPPNGSPGRGPRPAGGPLLDTSFSLSWPVWTCALNAVELRAMLVWTEIHAPEPDQELLRARGVEAVYRSTPVRLSDTVSVFRWGRRVV